MRSWRNLNASPCEFTGNVASYDGRHTAYRRGHFREKSSSITICQ